MPIDIRDARVLVVGASGGIGSAVADAFAVAVAVAVAGAQVVRPARFPTRKRQ